MKSDISEYKPVIQKLVEKTRQGRVEWRMSGRRSFTCTLGGQMLGPSFSVSATDSDDSEQVLAMQDEEGNELFRVVSNDLPTSPEEEEVSILLQELYALARRQALKVEEKLGNVLTLLEQA